MKLTFRRAFIVVRRARRLLPGLGRDPTAAH